MTEPEAGPPPGSELILYQTEDQRTYIDLRLSDGTVWLTQAQMAELFQTTPQNVTLHLGNIYEEREIDEDRTIRYYLIVRSAGAAAHGWSPPQFCAGMCA